MQSIPNSFLDPTVYLLAAIASILIYFLFDDESEKWYWRGYLWTVTGVNLIYGLFGPEGYFFGVAGTLLVLWVYFITFQKRQFSMRDMLLYVLILGCMSTQIASTRAKYPYDSGPAPRWRK